MTEFGMNWSFLILGGLALLLFLSIFVAIGLLFYGLIIKRRK